MISLNRRMLFGKIDPHEVGRHITGRFLTGIERAMKVRDERGDANFYDVDFRQLIKTPRDVIRAIKDWHGLDHDQESERRMDEWFTVVEGRALLELRDLATGERRDIELDAAEPRTVRVPAGLAHCIVNVGPGAMTAVAWATAEHDPDDVIPAPAPDDSGEPG